MAESTDTQEKEKWECGEWDVRHDRRPDKPHILTVTGQCVLPTTYRVVLKKHEPQDDPKVLLLDLVVNLPSRTDKEVEPGKVEHSEPFVKLYQERKAPIYVSLRLETDTEYETVTILDSETGEVIKDKIRVKPITPH
ncbi:MAG TPA: hypothetical protein VHJ40_06840 [Actinomycetota bacterium]|jgi:hypothetical protein|nr:hypothetical protein [Actinomycetota bacterium]